MWYDRDIDAIMRRTAKRPIPCGRIMPESALAFGIALSVLSVVGMALAANGLAAAILGLSIGFYVFVYTIWLKRRTPQNIVIGGAGGAFPPIIAGARRTRMQILRYTLWLLPVTLLPYLLGYAGLFYGASALVLGLLFLLYALRVINDVQDEAGHSLTRDARTRQGRIQILYFISVPAVRRAAG